MFIQTLVISSVLMAAPQAPSPPPSGTPETPRPVAQEPVMKPDSAAATPAAAVAFVQKAAEGGAAEVAIAKLALQKAENAEVKAFAERLEKDHAAVNGELKTLAAARNITLPAEKRGPVYFKLEKLSGAAFDRAFVAAMLTSHQNGVKAFDKEAASGADADIKAFAAKTLPTLKEHLQQVQTLSQAIAKKPTS
jgi:putative membrane protein